MATTYKTPGVYIEEIRKFPPSVAQVETAIPAFIGYTEKASKNGEDVTLIPTKISSLLEYRNYFGGPQKEQNIRVTFDDFTSEDEQDIFRADIVPTERSKHIMFYGLQSFFNNGGGDCYIVSVGPYNEAYGSTIVGGPLALGLEELKKEDEPTLIVFPEGQGMDIAEYHALQNSSLALCNEMQDRFAVMDIHHSGEGLKTKGDLDPIIESFRNGITDELKYGGAYFPNIRFSFDYEFNESNVTLVHNVDGEPGTGEFNEMTLSDLKSTDGSVHAKALQAVRNLPVNLPPSTTIVGIYAKVDSNRGVWKAPANVGVIGAQELTFKVTHDIQKDLNVHATGKSVNVIRAFEGGRGILVWGSRTLSGNDNEWRYVPVRRFFNMAEESIKKASAQFVFEPNDANTWAMVRAMIENFLILQWRAGALAGAKPEHAFYVKVGLGETMTALDILEGRMNVEVGMAVVRPAEFIILKFSHKMQES